MESWNMCAMSAKSFTSGCWLKTTKARGGNFNEGLGYSMARKRTHRGKKARIRVCR